MRGSRLTVLLDLWYENLGFDLRRRLQMLRVSLREKHKSADWDIADVVNYCVAYTLQQELGFDAACCTSVADVEDDDVPEADHLRER